MHRFLKVAPSIARPSSACQRCFQTLSDPCYNAYRYPLPTSRQQWNKWNTFLSYSYLLLLTWYIPCTHKNRKKFLLDLFYIYKNHQEVSSSFHRLYNLSQATSDVPSKLAVLNPYHAFYHAFIYWHKKGDPKVSNISGT